jgi:4-diphosphocytidyl-2-C-methyl-D-erythritol kinase
MGDEIYPLIDLPKYWVVLLIPPFGVSTGDAYNWYDSAKSQSHRRSPRVLPLGNSALAHVVRMVNDLEAPVVERFESIGKMTMAAGMSGSGSSVFGLFRSLARAKKAATGLATSGQHVILTRILSRNEYIRRSAVRVV